MAMQGEFECLLDEDGFKHIDTQTQRRRERHGRENTWIQRFKLAS